MSTPADTMLSFLRSLDNSEQLTNEFEESLRTLVLRIQGKGLTDSDVTTYVIPFLKANPGVTELNIANNALTSVGATALAAAHTLRTLNISGNPIKDDGATALAGSSALNALGCIRCQVTDVGTQALAGNTKLTVLNLAWNAIGDQGAGALVANTTLAGLGVSLDGLSDISIASLKAKQSKDFALDDKNSVGQIKVDAAVAADAAPGVEPAVLANP